MSSSLARDDGSQQGGGGDSGFHCEECGQVPAFWKRCVYCRKWCGFHGETKSTKAMKVKCFHMVENQSCDPAFAVCLQCLSQIERLSGFPSVELVDSFFSSHCLQKQRLLLEFVFDVYLCRSK